MPHSFAAILAQLTQRQQSVQDLQSAIFKWSLVFLGILVVLWLVAWSIRRRTQAEDDFSGAPTFALSDLRDMLADGRITQEEFDSARDRIIGATRRQLGVDESPGDAVVPTDGSEEAGDSASEDSSAASGEWGPELLSADNDPASEDAPGGGRGADDASSSPPPESDDEGPETEPRP